MKVPGLTQEEIYILSRNIGTSDKGLNNTSTPLEVNKILKKAFKNGTSEDDLAKIIGLEATTMFYRHNYIFDNLISKLHKKVIYGRSDMKKEREKKGYITFQLANELSRIDEKFQLRVYEFISSNHIHGWNDVKSIRELLEINKYKNIDKIFNEILERKGLDDHFRVGDKLDLMTLNKNLFKRTQDERDDIFLKIVKKVFDEEINTASLGYRFYEIVFEDKQVKISQKDLDSKKTEILEKIKTHK